MSTLLATLVFWASALLVAYTFAGYPLWALLQARLRPRAVARGDALPTATAILVVQDDEPMLEAKLENLLSLDYPEARFGIVVACDGVNDAVAARCRRYASPRVRVLSWPDRRGLPCAQATAVEAATGDVLLMVDVRQRIERGALRQLVASFADPEVGAVTGRLRLAPSGKGQSGGVGAYGRYEWAIRDAESRSGSVVGVTGAFFAMRRALYRPLPADLLLHDVLTPLQVAREGFRVVSDPGAIAWDRASPDTIVERSRRLQASAGSYQLLVLAPWLVHPGRNPLWFRFTSHRVMRLAAPWLMCLQALSGAYLATTHPFYLACLVGVAACVLVALAGPRLPLLSHSLPVRLLAAFWRVNLHAGRALLAFARNPRLQP